MAGRQDCPGKERRHCPQAALNLAHAYYAVGRLTDATKLLSQTLERCELSLPAGDPLTMAARTSLSNITGDSNKL